MDSRKAFFLIWIALAAGIIIGWQGLQGKQIPTAFLATQFSGQTGVELREGSIEMPILAVNSQTGEGAVQTARIDLVSGKGRVLFNTNPFVEPDTQQSVETAAQVAQAITNMRLQKNDLIYQMSAQSAGLVGGPSAGAALTLATWALLEGKKIRKDIAVTGTILPDGQIGQVGGILEKAQAAGKAGVKTFFVPLGESKVVFYERQIQERKGQGFILQQVNYIPHSVDLNQAMSQEYGMQVKEVGHILDLANLAFETSLKI